MRKRSVDAQEVAETTPGLSARSNRVLHLVQVVSGVYFVGAFFFTAFMLFVWLSSAFGAGASAISLPVGPSEAMEVPSLVTSQSMGGAHFTEVSFTAEGLSSTASLMYYAPQVLVPLAHGLIALAINRLARAASSSRPFNRSASRALTLSGATIAVIGTATQLLHNSGVDLARYELFGESELYGAGVASTPFDWSSLFIGIAIYVVAIIFTTGQRFQKEADGLI